MASVKITEEFPDASEMLAEALKQMDGLLAGTVAALNTKYHYLDVMQTCRGPHTRVPKISFQSCLLVKIRKTSQNKLVENMHYCMHKFLMCEQ